MDPRHYYLCRLIRALENEKLFSQTKADVVNVVSLAPHWWIKQHPRSTKLAIGIYESIWQAYILGIPLVIVMLSKEKMRPERRACEFERSCRDRVKFGANIGQWAVYQAKDLYERRESPHIDFFFLLMCHALFLS